MLITKFGIKIKVKNWNGDILEPVFGLDTETELIRSPSHIPRLVISTAYDGKFAYIITNKNIKRFLELHKNHTMVLHNFAFDKNVLNLATGFEFWGMIEAGKILDTALLYKLVGIATKGYTPPRWSLDHCVDKLLKTLLPKDDSIRLTFGLHINEDGSIDYKSMSTAHIKYAILDPVATFLIYEILMKQIKRLPTTTNLAHNIHLMGDIALDEVHRNGIHIDLEYTNKLRKSFDVKIKPELDIIESYGYVPGKKGNQKDYETILEFLELEVPKTKTGKVSMAAEDLLKHKGSSFIDALLKYNSLTHDRDFLNEFTKERIHPWYDSLKNTGRTGCRKPNIQNPPRQGGIRECVIPEEGYIFGAADYSSIEMFTAAECMKQYGLGQTMYDVLNEGRDPHIFAASVIHSVPEKDINKKDPMRQQAKPANYGFLANMSATTFIPYAAQYDQELTLDESTTIKKGWSNAYPEVKGFWKLPYKAQGLFISKTGFVRANCTYTAWLNTHFQGRAAEGAKLALYLCVKAGLKVVMFIHDEIIIESKIEKAKEELELLKELMIKGMKMVCKMNIEVEGELKERFCK